MDAKMLIAFGAAYAAIYYFAGRRLLFELRDIDPDYFKYLGALGGIGQSNSNAVVKMIFDSGVPKDFYPKGFRVRLAVVRIMLALSPVLLLGIFIAL